MKNLKNLSIPSYLLPIAAVVSVFAALVAFLIGWRSGGVFGGLHGHG